MAQTGALAAAVTLLALLAGAGCAPPPGAMPYPADRPPSTRPDPAGRILRVPRDHPTVQAALDAADDGDTVLLAPGRYAGPVRIDGKAVTLASQFVTTGDATFIGQTVIDAGKERQCIYVGRACKPATRIVGLTLRGGSDGITCYARCAILHNRFVGNGDGIDYEGGGGVCRFNTFDRCRDDAVDLDGDCAVRVEDNVIRDCGDDGLEIRFYAYRGARPLDVVIRRNLIDRCGEDGIQIIDHDGPSNRRLWIERNVIRGSAKAALGFMDKAVTREDYRAAPLKDPVYLLNNTLLDNGRGVTGGANVVAVNNVFAGTKGPAVLLSGGDSTYAHNLFWNNGRDWRESNVDAATAVRADPKLDADAAPTHDSPCLDAGVAVARRGATVIFRLPPESFAGRAPDIGARERPAAAAK